jgi:hypothetical protein
MSAEEYIREGSAKGKALIGIEVNKIIKRRLKLSKSK